jgi:hypothetical protein
MVGGKMTGGFAILAAPVKYRESGVMTGEKTTEIAASIKDYNPRMDTR